MIKGNWHRITGTALVAGKSRNGNVYTDAHLRMNDGKEVKFFVGDEHQGVARNVVGKALLRYESGRLNFDGRVRNTANHPDIVELAADKMVDVSIGASPIGERSESGSWEGVDIRHLALVGTPGVDDAKIDRVIAESFDIAEASNLRDDDSDDEDDSDSSEPGEDSKKKKKKMAELVDVKKKESVEENKMSEELIKENEALKAQLESLKEAKKNDLVESILKVNPKLDKKELMEKDENTLKIIESYELKLKESEESSEGEAEAEPEGNGAVESDEGEAAPVEESYEGIVYDKNTGTIGMNESLYKKFNKEIRESVYR